MPPPASPILARRPTPVRVVRFAPRGHILSAGWADGSLDMWSVGPAARLLGSGAHEATVCDVLYSPRLSLAVARTPERLHGWAIPDVRPTFDWHVGPIDDAVFLPDGNHVRVTRGDQRRIVDLRDGTATEGATDENDAPTPAPPSVPAFATEPGWTPPAFSAEGRLMAAGAPDGRIVVYDLERAREVRVLEGHEGPVTCVDFFHGRASVASGGHDGTVRLWDLRR